LQEIYEILTSNNYAIIKKIYKEADKQLKFTKYELSFSGTTANSIIIVGNKLINLNCGDSRSILVVEHLNSVNYKKINSI
jgi:serine/threonine protein phosphatase PrpC